MEQVLSKLETLKKTSSKNKKIELLKGYLQDPHFKRVVQYALDDLAHYNIAKMPPVKNTIKDTELTVPKELGFFAFLDDLKSKLGASKEKKQNFADFCGDTAWWEVAQRIVKKDLKCGIHAKTVNAAFPGLINVVPYQRCSSMSKLHNVNFPAFFQRKADSAFGYFFYEPEKEKILSRNGREFLFHDNFFEDILWELSIDLVGYVLMGELQVIDNNGDIMDRQTANGILNKALKGTISEDESSRVVYDVWDCVPIDAFWDTLRPYTTPYSDRRSFLYENIYDNTGVVAFIEEETVYSVEEAKAAAKRLIKRGEEGGILKDPSALWKDNTSTYMIKFKVEEDCDLIITGVYYGEPRSKYEKCVGRLQCESSDGKIVAFPGSGLSDELRGVLYVDDNGNYIVREDMDEYILETFINRIVTVRFNNITTDKKTKKETLYLPRVVSEIRKDKNEADSYEYIKDLMGQ